MDNVRFTLDNLLNCDSIYNVYNWKKSLIALIKILVEQQSRIFWLNLLKLRRQNSDWYNQNLLVHFYEIFFYVHSMIYEKHLKDRKHLHKNRIYLFMS